MIVFSASVFSTVWSFLAALAYSLGALLVRQITGVPIKFAGTSEKIDGLGRLMPSNMQVVFWAWATSWPWSSKSRLTSKRCIAANAGVQEQDVNRPVSEFGKMQDMMKKMCGAGFMKMMKKLGGMKGMQVGYKTLLDI